MAENLDELERVAKAALWWEVKHAWPTDEEGVWEVGHEGEEGTRYEVVKVDTANYFQPEAAEPLARFYAAAHPEAVAALIARVRELEADAARLNWIEGQASEGLEWQARQSSTGRGFRLHQGTELGATTAREAIDTARKH